jgi:hypothetical protein
MELAPDDRLRLQIESIVVIYRVKRELDPGQPWSSSSQYQDFKLRYVTSFSMLPGKNSAFADRFRGSSLFTGFPTLAITVKGNYVRVIP